MERDKKNRRSLTKKGWKVFVVWECKTKTASAFEKLQVRLFDFLEK